MKAKLFVDFLRYEEGTTLLSEARNEKLSPLGVEIDLIRRSKGWSADDLAFEMDVSSKTLWRSSQSGARVSARFIRKLHAVFGLSTDRIEELIRLDQNQASLNGAKVKSTAQEASPAFNPQVSNVRIVDYSELLARGWTIESIVQKFIEIDTAGYPNILPQDEGDKDQWAPIFHQTQYTWRAMLKDGEIIGYWHFLCLFDEEFALAKTGELREADIRSDHVQHMFLPSSTNYNMYVSSFIVAAQYQDPRLHAVLIRSFVAHIEWLASEGYYFAEICAVGVTPYGKQLCKALKLTLQPPSKTKRADENWAIYAGFVRDVVSNNFLNGISVAKSLYTERFADSGTRPDDYSQVGQISPKGQWLATSLEDLDDDEAWAVLWQQTDDIIGELQTPPGAENSNLSESDRWKAIARKSPDSHFRLMDAQQVLVGFWSLSFVKQSVYDRIRLGQNVHESFCVDDLDLRVLPGRYSVYFSDLFRRSPEKETPIPFGKHLLSSTLDYFDRLSDPDRGIYVDRIVTLLSTPEAISMCERIGFEYICDHEKQKMFLASKRVQPAKIYEAHPHRLFQNPSNATFLQRRTELVSKYQKEFS